MARVPLVQDDDKAARAGGIFDTFKGVLRLAQLVGSAYEWSHHRHLVDWVPGLSPAGGKQ